MDKRFDKSTNLAEESDTSEETDTESENRFKNSLSSFWKAIKKQFKKEKKWREEYIRQTNDREKTYEKMIKSLEKQVEILEKKLHNSAEKKREESFELVLLQNEEMGKLIAENEELASKVDLAREGILKAAEQFKNNGWLRDSLIYVINVAVELSVDNSKLKEKLAELEKNLPTQNTPQQLTEEECTNHPIKEAKIMELEKEIEKIKDEAEKSKKFETMLKLTEEELESIVGEWNIKEVRKEVERKMEEEEVQTKLEANIEVNTNNNNK